MTHKNVKMLILAIAVLVIATGGLIYTLKSGDGGAGDVQVGGQQIVDPADQPNISSPSKQPSDPEPRVDDRNP